VTCGRSVVFSGFSGFRHDIAEILLKVALNTIDPYILLPILGDNLLHYQLSRVLYNLLPVLGDNLLHYGLSRVLYEDKIWDITFQILEALNYLHSKQIRHSDVKRKFFYTTIKFLLSYMIWCCRCYR